MLTKFLDSRSSKALITLEPNKNFLLKIYPETLSFGSSVFLKVRIN